MFVRFLGYAFLMAGLAVQALSNETVTKAERLLTVLQNGNYKEREEATISLWEMGEEAWEILEGASNSDDPEVAIRAKQMLRYSKMGLSSGADPATIAILERYAEAETWPDKLSVYEEIKEAGNNESLFRLWHLETNEEWLEKLTNMLHKELKRLQALYLEEAKHDELLEIIELAPPEESLTLRKMALRKILESDKKSKTLEERYWESILKGDYDGAFTVVDGKKEHAQLAKNSILVNGNINKWLELEKQESTGDPVLELYLALLKARLGGQEQKEKSIYKSLENLTYGEDEFLMESGKAALLFLGQNQEGIQNEQVFEDEESSLDKVPTLTLEMKFEEALSILGLEIGKEVQKEWLDYRVEKILKGNMDEEMREFSLLICFLNFNGERKKAQQAFGYLWKGMEQLEQEKRYDLLEKIESYSPYQHFGRKEQFQWVSYYLDYHAENLPKDEEGLNTLARHLFGWQENSPSTIKWFWKQLNRFEHLDEATKLRYVTEVVEKGDRCNFEGLEEALWDIFDILIKEEALVEDWDTLRIISDLLRMNSLSFHIIEQQIENHEGREQVSKKFTLIKQLMWQEHHEEAVALTKDFTTPNLIVDEILHALSLEKIGEMERAKEQWLEVEKLGMGSANSWYIWGLYLYHYGELERALEMFQKAISTYKPKTDMWSKSLELAGTVALKLEKWKLLWAYREALLYSKLTQGQYSDAEGILKLRFEAEMGRGFFYLQENQKKNAAKVLKKAYQELILEGFLADEFFPMLRKYGLDHVLEDSFEKSFGAYAELLKVYPNNPLMLNTAAWFSSRAVLRVEEAQELIDRALTILPRSEAFLDTKAEVYFAKGQREKAVEWSNAACLALDMNDDAWRDLWAQNRHFRNDPLPK